MHVLSMSILLSLSSTSFAELVINPSSGSVGQASMNWSSEEASQLLNSDVSPLAEEVSPQGSTKVTTTVRSSKGVPTYSAPKTVHIIDTSAGYLS